MENEEIYSLLRRGEILEVEKALESVLAEGKGYDQKLLILAVLVEIFRDEVKSNSACTVFDYSTDIDELSKHYIRTKQMLRRIEFDMPAAYIDEFYEYCEYNGVSIAMIVNLIRRNIVNKEKVCSGLAKLYGEKKGTDSLEYGFYIKLSKSIGGDKGAE